jgi:hypothetical protein
MRGLKAMEQRITGGISQGRQHGTDDSRIVFFLQNSDTTLGPLKDIQVVIIQWVFPPLAQNKVLRPRYNNTGSEITMLT